MNESEISIENYSHAENVWNTFNIKTLGDYADLYLKTDVILLADIFEKFRRVMLNSYELDPCHYVTLPSFAFDAMLKMTGVELELLTDIDMLCFFERMVRGGLCQASLREAVANNVYTRAEKWQQKTLLTEQEEKEKARDLEPRPQDKYLMYFDINNLHGLAMTAFLPYGEFSWVTGQNLTEIIENFNEIKEHAPIGYVWEVDLKVPNHLHDFFSDLPPCPEHDKP